MNCSKWLKLAKRGYAETPVKIESSNRRIYGICLEVDGYSYVPDTKATHKVNAVKTIHPIYILMAGFALYLGLIAPALAEPASTGDPVIHRGSGR